MSKFRSGIVIGFATGYYLGAKAGRERYLQVNRLLGHLNNIRALEKARAVVDLSRERARTGADPLVDLTDTAAYSSN